MTRCSRAGSCGRLFRIPADTPPPDLRQPPAAVSQPNPAITQRLHLVPFNADFSGDRGDPTMPAQLREESGAILQWLIGGAVAYHEDGGTLRKCAAVEAATKGYFEAQSTFDHWLAECTTPDLDARTKAGDLYQSFAIWKETRGERPLSQTRWVKKWVAGFGPTTAAGRAGTSG